MSNKFLSFTSIKSVIHLELMKTLKIDNEIRDLIPKPTQEEIELLEQNILKDGIREPLCVWGGTLIDGHNRYEIAVRHGLEFDVKELDFVDRSDVIS